MIMELMIVEHVLYIKDFFSSISCFGRHVKLICFPIFDGYHNNSMYDKFSLIKYLNDSHDCWNHSGVSNFLKLKPWKVFSTFFMSLLSYCWTLSHIYRYFKSCSRVSSCDNYFALSSYLHGCLWICWLNRHKFISRQTNRILVEDCQNFIFINWYDHYYFVNAVIASLTSYIKAFL